MDQTRHTVHYRRKREGKTNYRTRLKLLKSRAPRVVIRKSLKNLSISLVEYKEGGDHVLFAASSRQLIKKGWPARSNLPTAYLTGYLFGKKALESKVNDAIIDVGYQKMIKGNLLYAALKGIVDAGLKVPHSEEVYPADDRIRAQHITAYAKHLKEQDKAAYERQFSDYIEAKMDPEKLTELFDKVKATLG